MFYNSQFKKKIIIIIATLGIVTIDKHELTFLIFCFHEMQYIDCLQQLELLYKTLKMLLKQKKILKTIMFIIFSEFLMFEYIFLSLQVKRSVISSNKHDIYQLPHELPNDFFCLGLQLSGQQLALKMERSSVQFQSLTMCRVGLTAAISRLISQYL